jgi:hypothetical protein
MTGTFTCPAGHQSTTGDYCDTCGAGIAPPTGKPAEPAPTGSEATPAPPVLRCSNCGADRTPDDLFCEVCGLDFATGKLPAPPPKPKEAAATAPQPAAAPSPVAAEWTAIVEADRAYFEKNQAEGGVTLTFPDGQAPREVPLAKSEVLVGRGGISDIDLNNVDPGVSHRHLRLIRRPDGDGWDVVDDNSANGTWLDENKDPIAPGTPVPLQAGSRIHIGAFTTITLRHDSPPGNGTP